MSPIYSSFYAACTYEISSRKQLKHFFLFQGFILSFNFCFFFHLRLSLDSDCQQDSSCLQDSSEYSIQSYQCDVWVVSIIHLISKSQIFFKCSYYNWYYCHQPVPQFLLILCKLQVYLFVDFFFHIVVFRNGKIHKRISFLFSQINTWSGLDTWIRWPICIPNTQGNLCLLFSLMHCRLCTYHLVKFYIGILCIVISIIIICVFYKLVVLSLRSPATASLFSVTGFTVYLPISRLLWLEGVSIISGISSWRLCQWLSLLLICLSSWNSCVCFISSIVMSSYSSGFSSSLNSCCNLYYYYYWLRKL